MMVSRRRREGNIISGVSSTAALDSLHFVCIYVNAKSFKDDILLKWERDWSGPSGRGGAWFKTVVLVVQGYTEPIPTIGLTYWWLKSNKIMHSYKFPSGQPNGSVSSRNKEVNMCCCDWRPGIRN